MPFLTPQALRRLADADPGDAPAVVAACGGALEPLLGCYQPSAAEQLSAAAEEAQAPLRAAVAALDPRLIEVAGAEVFNVNTTDDLAQAERLLTRT
jgi:molybdopterin-guanine dinucleotide biosynthesis protein A